jgi:flagellar hook-associated protein 1 FlgK
MSGLSGAIEIGRSALRAQQIGISVTGDNIANVNTPGFSRRLAKLETSAPAAGLGTGVTVADVSRARDQILDSQIRFQNGLFGRLEAMQRAFFTVEGIFSELAGSSANEAGAVFSQSSGVGLSGALSRFFNAFQDLANNPESGSARAVIREEGQLLSRNFRRLDDQLKNLQSDLESEFQRQVDQANTLLNEIGALNARIPSERGVGGGSSAPLEDRRDQLVEDLSKLMDISSREQDDGTLTVYQSGRILVDHAAVSGLSRRVEVSGDTAVSKLTMSSTGETLTLTGGSLNGISEVRDTRIPEYLSTLDSLASTLVSEVNRAHSAGFGLDGSSGTDFFDAAGTTSRTLQVNSAILDNTDLIAASSDGTKGNNAVALQISDLRLNRLFSGGTKTMEEFYGDLVGQVGSHAREVFLSLESQRVISEQLTQRRDNVRGVSVNEEAANLILFQRAYQAAARIVTIVDEMFQSVLAMG